MGVFFSELFTCGLGESCCTRPELSKEGTVHRGKDKAAPKTVPALRERWGAAPQGLPGKKRVQKEGGFTGGRF